MFFGLDGEYTVSNGGIGTLVGLKLIVAPATDTVTTAVAVLELPLNSSAQMGVGFWHWVAPKLLAATKLVVAIIHRQKFLPRRFLGNENIVSCLI